MANPAVIVDFLADTSKLSAGFRKASSGADGFSSKLGSMAKVGAAAAGAAGLAALTATLKIGISEYSEASKVAAQTNAVLKSTGGAAGVSAEQVDKLATSIMRKSGIDDEAIASGENLLLTFTNIKNEAGAGNDIFNQTTQIMADMSTAMGTDPQKSAIQLGKALNDPVKGITALSKVGVSFTQGQKDTIKALVESGDTMGAQKLILAELNKEFGGSAEAAGKTLPGQLKILRENFNNFAGELVGKMVPALTLAIAWLRDHWPEISAALQGAWASIRPVLVSLGELIVSVAGFIRDNWGTIGPIVMGVAAYFQAAFQIISGVLKLISALIRGDWSAAWQAFKQIVFGVLNLVENQIRTALAVYKAVLAAAWAAILAVATPAWNAIKTAVTSAIDAVKTAMGKIAGFVSGVWGAISTQVHRVADLFDIPKKAVTEMLGAIKSAFGGIDNAIRSVVGGVTSAVNAVVNAIKKPINAVVSAWNSLSFTVPSVTIPSVTILGKKIGGGTFGGFTIGFPNLPQLAAGGVVSRPTLAMVGEGAGREIVAPESLLRQIVAERPVEVRVFIGNTELKGLVRTEIVDANSGLARSILAGGIA